MSQSTTPFSPPAYERVRRDVLRLIAERNLQPGDRLPSERVLAEHFNLNHQTVRNGLADLVTQKIIERRIGAGSFVLANPNRVRELIRESHKEQTPETLAGVLVPSRMDLFATELLQHLHMAAESARLRLSVRMVDDMTNELVPATRDLLAQGASGLILPWRNGDRAAVDQALQQIAQSPLAMVLSWISPGLEKYCCESPEVCGRTVGTPVELVGRYLQAIGFGHIAFFGPDEPVEAVLRDRAMAYSRFASRAGLETHLGFANRTAADVTRIVERWRPMAGDLAVMCYDDEHAIRLMTALHKTGLRIPEDVGVVGFNDLPICESADPPLSTIRFDFEYLAQALVRHLQAQLRGESAQLTGPWPMQRMIVRDSCGGRLRMGDRLEETIARVSDELRTPLSKQ